MYDATALRLYLYAIEFSDGVVKVGRTKNLMQRLGKHSSDARGRGARMTRRWAIFADSRERMLADERRLIAFCAERWSLAWGAEYFAGADFDSVLDYLFDLEEQAMVDAGFPPLAA